MFGDIGNGELLPEVTREENQSRIKPKIVTFVWYVDSLIYNEFVSYAKKGIFWIQRYKDHC